MIPAGRERDTSDAPRPAMWRRTAAWLAPSLFAICIAGVVAGLAEALLSTEGLVGVIAAAGFACVVAVPAGFAAALVVRGLWAAWRPRSLRAEIVEAVAPFGYTKETLEGFLARLTELERLGREQESAKGMKQSATAELSKTGKALRTWYLPWRKRMNGALRGKPEFRVRLGLSA